MKIHTLAILAALLAIPLKAEDRPAKWAAPSPAEGLPNLHKVSDTLYRSAQPTEAGMLSARKLGVRTVVSLRSFHSDRDEIGKSGLGDERLSMKTWHPEEEDIVKFLKIATDPEKAPVLVHCQHGSDRTGTLCTIYRIVVQGWTKEEAVGEMTEGEFGFHEIWKNLPPWIMELDVESLRKQAGIAKP
jgi:protein tyrosine/serine phosphatase